MTEVARSDYAGNGGDYFTDPSYAQKSSWNPFGGGPPNHAVGDGPSGRRGFENIASVATGVIYCGSEVTIAMVTDGTSHTFLAGEKNLSPDYYDTGESSGDNENMYMGRVTAT